MIITLENGKELRNDWVISAVLRSDLVPIPVSLEAEIRTDSSIEKYLQEGKTIQALADTFRIIKIQPVVGNNTQGIHSMNAVKITALLEQCHQVSFRRKNAVIKSDSTLQDIYSACGAKIKMVNADFKIPRFVCPKDDAPTFHIARAIQEEGGVVAWKKGSLKFYRLPDLFTQKAVMQLPNNGSENVESGFLTRHQVPNAISVAKDGSIITGEASKSRSFAYSPAKDVQKLNNMARCLVLRKVSRIYYAPKLCAGDVIDILGGKPLVILTAAHVFQSGTDSGAANQYSKLWLAGLEK